MERTEIAVVQKSEMVGAPGVVAGKIIERLDWPGGGRRFAGPAGGAAAVAGVALAFAVSPAPIYQPEQIVGVPACGWRRRLLNGVVRHETNPCKATILPATVFAAL